MQKENNSRLVLAVVLIAAGVIWLFRQAGHFPIFAHIHIQQFFMPFRHLFNVIDNTLFSWQVIIMFTGIVLLAGRRSAGIILVVFGGLFLLPEILPFSVWSLSFLIPALLIGTGIVLILKNSLNFNE